MKREIRALRYLNSDDIERIHQDSLEILWEMGMRMTHAKAVGMLSEAGAKVDEASNMVRFPPDLIEKSLKTVPKSIILGARNPKHNLIFGPDGGVHTRPFQGSEGYVDLRTRQFRLVNLNDVREWARLVDGLENISYCGAIFPRDVPLEGRDVLVVKEMLGNTEKHIDFPAYDEKGLKAVIDIAIAVVGSKEELKRRPIVSCHDSTMSPLEIMDHTVDNLLLAGEYGIPVEVNSNPCMGGTSPMTIAGSILQVNLEILSLIVISQLANPGAPLIYRPLFMQMDMATGVGVFGAIESAMAQAALLQFAREKYHIPTSAFGQVTDAMIADGQSQIERAYHNVLAGLAGANAVSGAGELEHGYAVDPVQLVIDNDNIGMLLRALRGFEVNESTLAKELIKKVGPGGNYLGEIHTVQHFRRECFRPRTFNRKSRSTWLAEGAKDLNRAAQERAIQILKEHEVPPLDVSVQKEIDQIFRGLQ